MIIPAHASSTRTYHIYRFAMHAALSRVGTWILAHPRLVTALVFTALVVAAFVIAPAIGVAKRPWRP